MPLTACSMILSGILSCKDSNFSIFIPPGLPECLLYNFCDAFLPVTSTFSAFITITKIKNIDIQRVEDLIFVDIKATGFLYGMVRLIIGQLVLVGENKISPEIFTDRWVNKKKNDVKESAPAKGLCFVNAVYEENVFKKINNNDFFPVFLIKGFS